MTNMISTSVRVAMLIILIYFIGHVNMQEAGSIRLVDGTRASQGRVEIFYNNTWGTVCDDSFDVRDATVVCRMLNYTRLSTRSYYGQGRDPTWLDDVNCQGSESSLSQCDANPWGVENCNHNEDVGVDCDTPEADAIRLVDGTRASNGRIEVLYDKEWGTICDDGFDLNAAKVVCRMLNFTGNSITFLGEGYNGQGSGRIWLDNLACQGNESKVWQCMTQPWGQANCGHGEDIHIDCDTPANAIRLMYGTRPSEGRVEIYHNKTWGTVCDDHFDVNAAQVACRMLNYTWNTFAFYGNSSYHKAGSGQIWLDDVQCRGDEASLSQCQSRPWGRHNCSHSDDVGVDCETHRRVGVPVRLVNGRSDHEGRVEIYYKNKWHTWCGTSFSMREANVICKQRGLSKALYFLTTNATFGSGIGDILKNPFVCQGTEKYIAACSSYSGWQTTTTCNHSMDAGVICDPKPEPEILRLVDGTSTSNGRVEVLYNNEWGTICDDEFDLNAAQVVCRMLNFTGNSISFHGQGYYGQGSGKIWLDNLNCQGVESTISQCMTNAWGSHNCGHSEDVHVDCETPADAIRLMSGTRASQGRVEVFHNKTWGTICDDEFDVNAAKVVCRKLNYTRSSFAFQGKRYYSEVSGTIWLDDVQCQGDEASLSQCQSRPWGQNNCSHRDDVGVDCETHLLEGIPIRLVDGRSGLEGRVEIFYSKAWHTWCGASFSMSEARVICKQLGFNTAVEFLTTNATFGSGTGDILKNPFVCQGTEKYLAACSTYSGWQTTTSCNHSMDAGVICDLNSELHGRESMRELAGNESIRVTWFYVLGGYAALITATFAIVTATLCRRGRHRPDNRPQAVAGMEIGTVSETAIVSRGDDGGRTERYQSLLGQSSPPEIYENATPTYEQCSGNQEEELYEVVN